MATQSKLGIWSQRWLGARRAGPVGSGLHGQDLMQNTTRFIRKFPMPVCRNVFRSLMLFTLLCASLGFAGCNRKEKVIDIETPAGEIEVERSKDTGKIDVEVDRN